MTYIYISTYIYIYKSISNISVIYIYIYIYIYICIYVYDSNQTKYGPSLKTKYVDFLSQLISKSCNLFNSKNLYDFKKKNS